MTPDRVNKSKLKRKSIFVMRILRTVRLGLWMEMRDQNKNLESRPLGLSMSYTWKAHTWSTSPPSLLLVEKKCKAAFLHIYKWTLFWILSLIPPKTESITLYSREWRTYLPLSHINPFQKELYIKVAGVNKL